MLQALLCNRGEERMALTCVWNLTGPTGHANWRAQKLLASARSIDAIILPVELTEEGGGMLVLTVDAAARSSGCRF